MQAPIAVVSALLGAVAWWTIGNALWAVGAIIMIANWPYTLSAIMPIIRQLEATPQSRVAHARAPALLPALHPWLARSLTPCHVSPLRTRPARCEGSRRDQIMA
jgi:hypothetical protein